MATYAKILKDSSGNFILPYTRSKLVYMENNATVEDAINGKAASSHTHDDRYYTESEVDTKLNGKSNTNHTHSYMPLSGGTFTGTVYAKSQALSGTYMRNCLVQNSSGTNVPSNYILFRRS